MRTPGFTLCAALAVTVLTPGPALASAPRAPGATAGTVAVTPSALAPGTEAALQVTGCAGRDGRATSAAFVDAVPLANVAAGLVGDARVRSTADPGTYAVFVHCDGEDARAAGSFEVVPAPAGGGDGTDTDADTEAADGADATGDQDADPTGEAAGSSASDPLSAPHADTPEPPASPSAPVRAGGGWTATHPQPYPHPHAHPHPAAARTPLARTAAVPTAARYEGDGAYAVGLVLAGGAILALTGQALRMRRRRKGSGDGDAG
ncbi:hypothetical protein [Streptomyces paromomycinus]|uniref:Sortase n=1 Tax=Streptomyces paromomycinus TaxID=92743 RepID=A0A401W8C7_STREY|nr:hypothetical protein [Streptomyces paromomycinus]GCD45574.1 hypothetical protein GKJPGBOP_05306 [Streptomyces paromomycinus]